MDQILSNVAQPDTQSIAKDAHPTPIESKQAESSPSSLPSDDDMKLRIRD